jgi:hypothetical protein
MLGLLLDGVAEKPILLPRPRQLDQIAGLDQAPDGKSREWLIIRRSTSRPEKPSIFEGALWARSDPEVVEFASGDASRTAPAALPSV